MNAETLCSALEQDGAIAKQLSGFERRDSQLDLVRLIVRAFNEDAVAVAEAGTGVGKSFAYLLPAIEYALTADERIVISTATITLQEQLYEKDIPLVLSALGKDIKCLLVKGRANYLCSRRLSEARLEPPLDEAENNELSLISGWAKETKTGSRSDLSFLPSPLLWSRLCSESDTCLGLHCAERENCFFMTLRKEALEARILVVNHHLLFADLAARHEGAGYESAVVLPPFARVIIDEAHTIENSATSFFSKGWNRLGINRSLSRLYRKRRSVETGLLLRLAGLLPGGAMPDTQSDSGKSPRAAGKKRKTKPGHNSPLSLFSGIPKLVSGVREAAEAADTAALSLCGNEGLYRFKSGNNDPIVALRDPLEKFLKAIKAFTARIRTMIELVEEENPTVWEVKAILQRFESVAEICTAFLEFGLRINDTEDDSEVFWLERQGSTRDNPWVTFTVTPVSIAPMLKEALFEANKTVICVSATLSIGRREESEEWEENREINVEKQTALLFRFWAERNGAALANRDFLYGIFPSPFPYEERTLLAVPADAPLPDAPDWEIFLADAITELIRLAGGSALVLFTSYQSLQNVHAKAAPELENEGIRCLKQGDDDRTRLLQQFLEEKTTVLFGTDSFWEGVDAPGETLRLLILCRLPFKTLKDPVFEARRECLENSGRNAFAELSLPDAVMKFKQGFGRLMRNSEDYGAVVILDGRILHKYYGKIFLQSLPVTKTSFKEFNALLRDLEQFFFPPL